jgi:hypothetical protein
MPRDEALAENPPVGAMIDYYLKSSASSSLVIEIVGGKGEVVRRYSSDDKAPAVKPETLQFPAFWRPVLQPVSTAAGMHRWIWDLHYTEVLGSTHLAGDEFVVAPRGVTALPGTYTVRMTVAGKSYSQPLSIKMDPRIKTSTAELQKQFDAAIEVSRRQSEISEAQRNVKEVLSQARQLRSKASENAALASALDAFIGKAEDVAGAPGDRFGVVPSKPAKEHEDLESLHSKFARIFSAVNDGDSAPTADAMQAFGTAQTDLDAVMAKWAALKSQDLSAVNSELRQAGFAPIAIGAQGPSPVEEDPDDSDAN